MRHTLAAAVGLGLLGVAGAAGAQTADALVDGLLPKTLSHVGRGLKGLKPQGTQAAAAPAAPAAKQPTVAEEDPSVSLIVQFATGSAGLTPQATELLDRLGTALTDQRLAGAKFRIEGHTDTVGTQAANQALSEQRAQAVVAYLVAKFSLTPDRLEPVGLGESGLAVATGPQVAEQRNRRVRVVNVGA